MSGEYYTCAFCGKQEETAIVGDDCGTIAMVEHCGVYVHSSCCNDYTKQFGLGTLKDRIDALDIEIATLKESP